MFDSPNRSPWLCNFSQKVSYYKLTSTILSVFAEVRRLKVTHQRQFVGFKSATKPGNLVEERFRFLICLQSFFVEHFRNYAKFAPQPQRKK